MIDFTEALDQSAVSMIDFTEALDQSAVSMIDFTEAPLKGSHDEPKALVE
jgi:hypothetical protein